MIMVIIVNDIIEQGISFPIKSNLQQYRQLSLWHMLFATIEIYIIRLQKKCSEKTQIYICYIKS